MSCIWLADATSFALGCVDMAQLLGLLQARFAGNHKTTCSRTRSVYIDILLLASPLNGAGVISHECPKMGVIESHGEQIIQCCV